MVIRFCAALLLAVLIGIGGGAASAGPERFIPALETGDAIPPIPLIGQDGRRFTFADFAGKAVLVSFIYTRCQDARMCPLVSAKFARMQQTIGSAPIRLVLLTLDPGYDTPAILKRYGRAFEQNPRVWTLATGSQTTIDELAGRFGIAASATAPGIVVHTEAAIVLGPDGRIAQTIFGNVWTSAELMDSARATLPGSQDRFAFIRSWLNAALERCGGAGVVLGASGIGGIFGGILAIVGFAFWLAFRKKPISGQSMRGSDRG